MGDGWGGDLYDADMGDDVTGGEVEFGLGGEYRFDHHSVYGHDRHFSWDTYYDDDEDPYDSDVGGVHGTVHDGSGEGGNW